MDAIPPPVEIVTADAPQASVIWLHGLGADGNDFVPVVRALQLPPTLAIRFVFPHAPQRPVTINGGLVMRAWYDIYDPAFTQREDEEGILDATARVRALIRRETQRGIPPARIVLAGFSQGGAIALHAGLTHPETLAGILALSTYLPLASQFPANRHEANRATPVLMIHGDQDPIVPLALAQTSRRLLENAGQPLEWHVFPMAHEVNAAAIETMGTWLEKRLPTPARKP